MLLCLRFVETSSYTIIWDFQFSISAGEIWIQRFRMRFLLSDFFFLTSSNLHHLEFPSQGQITFQNTGQSSTENFYICNGNKRIKLFEAVSIVEDAFVHFHAAGKKNKLMCVTGTVLELRWAGILAILWLKN